MESKWKDWRSRILPWAVSLPRAQRGLLFHLFQLSNFFPYIFNVFYCQPYLMLTYLHMQSILSLIVFIFLSFIFPLLVFLLSKPATVPNLHRKAADKKAAAESHELSPLATAPGSQNYWAWPLLPGTLLSVALSRCFPFFSVHYWCIG